MHRAHERSYLQENCCLSPLPARFPASQIHHPAAAEGAGEESGARRSDRRAMGGVQGVIAGAAAGAGDGAGGRVGKIAWKCPVCSDKGNYDLPYIKQHEGTHEEERLKAEADQRKREEDRLRQQAARGSGGRKGKKKRAAWARRHCN